MNSYSIDMYRVVFLPALSGREESSVWHPARSTAERWADYFARKGYAVAIQLGMGGRLEPWAVHG